MSLFCLCDPSCEAYIIFLYDSDADPLKSCVLAVAPTRTTLRDEEKRVADQVLSLPPEKRNVRELLSKENLIKYGFLNPTTDRAPRRMTKKKQVAAKAPRAPKVPKVTKASLTEKARGKLPAKESMNYCDAYQMARFEE